ncbi:serine protease [Pseudonocardia sp. WMMC193]|uniref:trypsin-like serine peptidase n=1 Tax=Pseudonocardia sp. WMMC193 TaxID=2911965 RepID=UPI001F1D12A4|nr:serine protease [Pseudonocardia sp. WMMC193]MCF7550317.1 serine protease [Pseudonocardia sp. WMMC193]
MRGTLRGARRLTAAVGLLVLLAGCAATEAGAPLPQPRPAATAQTAVGALFDGSAEDLGDHYCSASVVDSPAGDLLLTAAHCVASGDGTPAATGMAFVPGYHDGQEPYGVWTVRSAAVDPHFIADADPDYDVAFLTVDGPVQNVTGGFPVTFDPGAGDQVDAVGYPMEDDAPTVRSGVTEQYSPTQLELPAPGLEDGTSGGPWLRPDGAIVGLTGGYEQGGYTFDTSYSTYLDPGFESLRDEAVDLPEQPQVRADAS